ncbi:MAG: prepilin-type N-terminal cleavage/methylation domain-containing protein [Terrimicrobiaceae bacterium]
MKPPEHRHPSKRSAVPFGFSLIELLVVIAVIAVIAAIAIPNIPGVINAVTRGRDQRNAQSLAGLAAGARGAGHPPWASKSEAIADLTAGFSLTNSGHVIDFRLDGMSPEDQASAAAFLSHNGSDLIYTPSGGQPTNL